MKKRIEEYKRHEVSFSTKEVTEALNEKFNLKLPEKVKMFEFNGNVDFYWYEK